jgi:GNAT superfamily N-acetyltransferase
MAFRWQALVGQRCGGVMDQETAERIRQGWRAELGAPAAFLGSGRHVHLRTEDDPARAGWVGVVTLGDATCVSLPATAPAWLYDLRRRDQDADLTEPAVVATVIGPVEQFVGPATLAFLDPTAVRAQDRRQMEFIPAGHDSVRRLAAACGPQDTEESGLLAVDSPVVVCQAAGRVVAASGYRVWHGRLAHLSVLVDPAHRGRGLGTAVAAGAVNHALAAGLVPQWRARSTLLASRRIARSLGFEELGRQATYKLALPWSSPVSSPS